MPVESGVNNAASLVAKGAEVAFIGLQHLVQRWEIKKNDDLILIVNLINKLWRDHLKELTVPKDEYVYWEMPPIFIKMEIAPPKLPEEKETQKGRKRGNAEPIIPLPKPVTKIIFQTFELDTGSLEKILKIEPKNPLPKGMLNYIDNIREALKLLVEYYRARLKKDGKPEEGDTTANTTAYIILMLAEHCLQFTGKQHEIEYIEKLCRFINAFASIRGSGSTRFISLSPIYSQLKLAQDTLTQYVDTHYADSLVKLLMKDSNDIIDGLIRAYTKLIMGTQHWATIEKVDMLLLAEGKIKKTFESKAALFAKDNAVYLPKKPLPFGKWIERCAWEFCFIKKRIERKNPLYTKYKEGLVFHKEKYLNTPCLTLEDDTTKLIKIFFQENSFFRLYNNMKVKKLLIDTGKKPTRRGSILSISPDIQGNKQELHDINANRKTLHNLILVIKYMLEFLHISYSLEECIHQERKNYLANPQVAKIIFSISNAVKELLNDRKQISLGNIVKMQRPTNKNMIIDFEQELYIQLKDLLEKINKPIETVELMVKYHQRAHVRTGHSNNAPNLDVDRLTLLKPFIRLAQDNEIETGVETIDNPLELLEPSRVTTHNTHSSLSLSCDTDEHREPSSAFASQDEEDANKTPRLPAPKNALEEKITKTTAKTSTKSLYEQLMDAYYKCNSANAIDSNSYEFQVYWEVIRYITDSNEDAKAMRQESSFERKEKGKQIQELTKNFTIMTRDQLLLKPEIRKADFKLFCNKIREQLEARHSLFLDTPKERNGLYKILRTLTKAILGTVLGKKHTLFMTRSREKAEDVRTRVKVLFRKHMQPN